jgi:hypothetical protein
MASPLSSFLGLEELLLEELLLLLEGAASSLA